MHPAAAPPPAYTLDADIQSGSIITVHFPNGGYLSIDAEIDEDGNASDIDSRGRSWEFNVGMGLIEAAVEEWDEAEEDFEVE